jgi:cobalt-zinc-cadmium efflux system membrane fusion protein
MLKGMLVLFGQYLGSKRHSWVWGLLAVVLMGALAHCIHKAKQSTRVPPIIYQGSHLVIPEHSAVRSVVQIAPVHLQTVATTVVVPATVETIPAKTVAILPPLSGQITHIYKIIGETVKLGEPLYTLVSPDLAQAYANYDAAQAAYILAEKNLKRQRQLAKYEINVVRDLEQAESDFQQAEAGLRSNKDRLMALHSDVNEKNKSGHLVVRSPIDGVVTSVDAGVGTYWSDLSEPVVTVADLSQVYLVASAQEHDLPDFFLGQDAEALFERPDRSIVSQVEFIDPILNSDTRTINVGISLDNTDGSLRPNMYARMKFKRKPQQTILLPMTAVIQRGFDSIIFVEKAPWEFEPRVVQVGLQVGDNIVIESGLAAGERVAMTGGIILND